MRGQRRDHFRWSLCARSKRAPGTFEAELELIHILHIHVHHLHIHNTYNTTHIHIVHTYVYIYIICIYLLLHIYTGLLKWGVLIEDPAFPLALVGWKDRFMLNVWVKAVKAVWFEHTEAPKCPESALWSRAHGACCLFVQWKNEVLKVYEVSLINFSKLLGSLTKHFSDHLASCRWSWQLWQLGPFCKASMPCPTLWPVQHEAGDSTSANSGIPK